MGVRTAVGTTGRKARRGRAYGQAMLARRAGHVLRASVSVGTRTVLPAEQTFAAVMLLSDTECKSTRKGVGYCDGERDPKSHELDSFVVSNVSGLA